MTKKNSKFEKWCLDVLEEYVDVLNLQSHKMSSFSYSKDEDDGAYFRVCMNYPYKNYFIRYYDRSLQMFADGELDMLRHGLMHELIHVIVGELQAKANSRSTNGEVGDAVELLVDHMAIVMRKYVD